ncbi:hypothetical protein [Frankia sp. AgB32]|uniref:hypothetical protein n=1 Tax=Frankia sp. AgB32 TaxID=631119 RepID=UPI00200D0C21|nr:hypothetical protein [Frankia sp. AgB32]MCK9898012.1 hypothetical protein [Frankia sp. AgB32]
MHSISRGVWSVLHDRALDVPITPQPGTPIRTCRPVLLALVDSLDSDSDDLTGTLPELRAIAEHAEMSEKTAGRVLRALEASGLVVITPRTRRFRLVMDGDAR